MRCDLIRRVLVVVVAGLLFLPAALFTRQKPTPAHSARISLVSGVVTVTRPGTGEEVPALSDTPIEEGSELSTSERAHADLVDLENGALIHLRELSKVKVTQISTDAESHKLGVITLDQGRADFSFICKHQSAFEVNFAEASFTPSGRTELETEVRAGKVRVGVVEGSVLVTAHSSFLILNPGQVMEYDPVGAEVAKSHARVVRLSYVSGTVMVKRSASAEPEKAMLNTPIQEGFELSTSSGSYAEVEFENGSTARLGEQSQLLFHQLALDADGNKLNGLTFERGYATFHFVPERNSPSETKKWGNDGIIYFLPASTDVYHVKVADATVTSHGKCEFRTDLVQGRYRVEIFKGPVDIITPTLSSSQIFAGKILEHQSGSPELAFSFRKKIVKDAWDRWTEARDQQVLLTENDEAVHPIGPRYAGVILMPMVNG